MPSDSSIKPGGFPRSAGSALAAMVSTNLGRAGFRRAPLDRRAQGGGFRVGKGSRSDRVAMVTWRESHEAADERRRKVGLTDFGGLGPSPLRPQFLAAYANALSRRFEVDISDRGSLTVHPLAEPPAPTARRPLRRAICNLLAENSLPVHTGNSYAQPTGCAVVQEPDHVYLRVIPWQLRFMAVDSWTDEELSAVVVPVERALTSAAYAFTRADDICGAVLRITGRTA